MTDEIGHNSGVSVDELRSFVDRIERLEDEKQLIASQVRDVKAEAKAKGFDIKAINEVLKLKRRDPAEARAAEDVRAFYCDILDVFS